MARDIAVIVCTCDRYDVLPGCLASLRAQTLPHAAFEIVVIDNTPAPEKRERFAAEGGFPPGVRRLVSERPGLSRARNLGLASVATQRVAFIDDDALADPTWLADLMDAFDVAADVAVAGGPVVPLWRGTRPAWLGGWHEGFLSLVDRGFIPRDLGPGEWLAGTNIAYDRARLRAAGGFDEVLGRHPGTLMSNEEVAVTERLRRAGYRVRYAPRAEVRHIIEAERLTQAWMRRRVAWQAISDLALFEGEHASVAELWQFVATFLARLPPEHRNLVGLTRDLDDPELARAQGDAITSVMRLLAGRGESLEAALLGPG